jgi:carboxymethylenebutenolidase
MVVLHGCGGFDTLDHDLAADLPASGITTLYVDYFGLTPPPDGRGFCDAFGHAGDDFPIWQRIVVDAAAALKRQPSVDPKRVGVVGWSLGGAVALAAAEFGSTPAGTAPAHGGPFRAVVLYSSAGFGPLLDGAHVLPPTLILSGGSTDAIPLSAVLPLHQALVAAHVPSELFVYPHGSHSWPGPQGAAGLRHTVAFLRRYLASAR